MRLLRRLGDKGAAAVEFALIAPMFFLLAVGIIEIGYMVFVQSVLDGAARDAARLVRTGQATGSTAQQIFQTRLCSDVAPIINCNDIVYQAQEFASWSSAQTSLNTPPQRDKNGNLVGAGFTAGSGQEIMVVQVSLNYHFMTMWIGGQPGSSFLMSTVAFRNEPFPSPPG